MSEAYDTANITDPELRFFLPTTEGLMTEWENDQLLYCECCRHGAYKIACAIRDNSQISVKALYDIAADTRYKIAQLMRKPIDEYTYYGVYYFPFNHKSLVIDPVTNKQNSRWGVHFGSILEKLSRMCEAANTDPDFCRKQYGENYIVEAESKDGKQVYSLRYQLNSSKESFLISKITHENDNLITLKHVPAVHLQTYLSLIQGAFDQLIQNPSNNNYNLVDNLVKFRQLLFHSTPLIKGSQTATQMVIAGIMIHRNLDLVPFVPEYDHFMDAELFTHKEYAEKGGAHFGMPLTTKGRKDITVDNNYFVSRFQDEGRDIAEIYSNMNSLAEKIECFLLSSIYNIVGLHGISRFDISKTFFEYEQGFPRHIRVECEDKEKETIANKALDFFGISTVLGRIGEESLLHEQKRIRDCLDG